MESEVPMNVVCVLSFVFSIYVFLKTTYPALVEEHRYRQEARLKWDGYQPVWFMCWTYWFGLEKLVFGSRIHPEERMAAYMRREFD